MSEHEQENLNNGVSNKGVSDSANQNLKDLSNDKSLEKINTITTPVAPKQNDFSELAAAVKHLEQMKQLASVFVKGGLCPIKKEEDVIIAIITGNQLGLPYTTSINNIFPINGKPGMSAHLIRALLLQNGIVFNKDYDFEPMYQYYEGDLDANGKLVARKIEVAGKDKPQPILRGVATLDKIDETKYVAGRVEVDRVTQYTFTRMLKQANGEFKEIKVVSSFKMSEANTAGLLGKDNWKNYPVRMCDARAFTAGAREIASDIIFGMYSINELADTYDIPYTITDTLEEAIIQDAVIVK